MKVVFDSGFNPYSYNYRLERSYCSRPLVADRQILQLFS
jgi:hypothetical protein